MRQKQERTFFGEYGKTIAKLADVLGLHAVTIRPLGRTGQVCATSSLLNISVPTAIVPKAKMPSAKMSVITAGRSNPTSMTALRAWFA